MNHSGVETKGGHLEYYPSRLVVITNFKMESFDYLRYHSTCDVLSLYLTDCLLLHTCQIN